MGEGITVPLEQQASMEDLSVHTAVSGPGLASVVPGLCAVCVDGNFRLELVTVCGYC